VSTIVTRTAKNAPLTQAECDANFTNLNTDKLERNGGFTLGSLGIGSAASAWGSTAYAVQGGSAMSAWGRIGSGFGANVYVDSAGAYRNVSGPNVGTIVYLQNKSSGTHDWAYTPNTSVAADSDISSALLFTQMSLSSGGTLTVAGGTKYSSTSSDPFALDAYQESTFTPTVVGLTTAGTATYSARAGNYTRIGNRIFFDIQLVWSGHTGSGGVTITGLPVAAARSTPVTVYLGSSTSQTLPLSSQQAVIVGSTIYPAGVASGSLAQNLLVQAAGDIIISGHYGV